MLNVVEAGDRPSHTLLLFKENHNVVILIDEVFLTPFVISMHNSLFNSDFSIMYNIFW